MATLKVKEIQAAMGAVQDAIPVVDKRMGKGSVMMNALHGVEASLALLLRQSAAIKSGQALSYMDKTGFQSFEYSSKYFQ